ncbi:hypothetical protein Trydic_g13678 [Trypoxylus dichotomus]
MRFLKLRLVNFPQLRNFRRVALDRVDTVLVHGGAGTIPESISARKIEGVQNAAHEAYISLKETGSALDAIERAIKIMENNEVFNAGYGSYLNEEGNIEMSASIIEGGELSAGACYILNDIKHPIALAKVIMMKTKHVLLTGHGAMQFAYENGFQKLPAGMLVSPGAKQLWEKKKTSSIEDGSDVGAIVLSKNGHLVAGVSAGGRNRRVPGECNDGCYLGSGVYADNTAGAVCCTGDGTSLAKMCLAYAITKNMITLPVMEVIKLKLDILKKRLNQQAGVITISKTGEIGVFFTTPNMVWACQQGRNVRYGIKPGEVETMRL